ncbi:MAG: protease modulator HflC [Sphingomonas sp.]
MNGALFRNPVTLGIAALIALIIAASTFIVVPETQQGVILRFERSVGTVNPWRPNQPFGNTGAGLMAKLPFIDKVVWVDKRVLDVDLDNQQVLSTDQLRLEVDAFARFRVVDALKMVNTARTEDNVIEQLRPLLGSALRNELGKRQFAALLSPERGQVMANIRAGLQTLASQYGVQIVDVRIKHADLPSGSPLESSLNRMRTARQQQAATIRAQGQKQAQIIRAGAEADASRVYAQSFNRDPDFYDFYRAMQSYRQTFGADGSTPEGETSIILSPNNEYLKQFMGRGR